ncbi:threonine/serine exporter family protein [Actinoplanes solisilvae]|uniref:threonine/serine exporter family protein n=1 Tax=Actinoplanes solisilvae TaxID=2486853 RepID=UPI0013E2FBED|nr:threonine/serine exporter family protein [Actinoplanes solisilvae]
MTDRITADTVAEAVGLLHANGAETARTLERAAQIGRAAGVGRVTFEPGWSSSYLEVDGLGRHLEVVPANVAMNRAAAADEAIDDLSARRATVEQTLVRLRAAAALPPAGTVLFAAACAVGASGLSIILGVRHAETVAVIAVSAAVGAVIRRLIGRLGGNNFWQAGAAALIAGLIGAAWVVLGDSSALRLAAVCPCMVLVPGPHLLNGALDVAANRLPLGLARLTFATVTLLCISTGLLLGLAAAGADLALDAPGRDIPLPFDVVVAGVVAVCYGIFYSAPLRMLYWPLLVGGLAHGVHWVAQENLHWNGASASGLAALVAGAILGPVSRRFRMPFAAIGFASVVSMMPGLLVFRAMSGLVQLQHADGARATALLAQAINDITMATATVFLLALGLLMPAAVDRVIRRRRTR